MRLAGAAPGVGPTISPVPPASDEEISVPDAAKLLGLKPHTVRALIERGELQAEVTYVDVLRKVRRSFHLTRRDVDDFIERARVRPGDLRHLHPNWTWARYG